MSDATTAQDGIKRRPRTIDVEIVRRRAFPILPWVLATAADVAALALLVAYPGAVVAAVAAAVLHLAAGLPLAREPALAPSERALAAALTLTLPLAGAPLAALALGTVGRCEITQAPPDDEDALPDSPDPDEVRRLAEALPCCEALLGGTVEERRGVIATLTRRADGDALALLRWALGAPDAELAVEAALALEDIGATFEGRLDAARREAHERPSFDTVLAAADVLGRAIDAGIADPALIPSLAHEARGLFDEAARLDPTRQEAVALQRAHLELAVLRPDSALACIDSALGPAAGANAQVVRATLTPVPATRRALLALREEAVLATHVLPWEGPSALASYRPAAPPPLTARRRLVRTKRGTGGGTSSSAPRLTLVSRGEVPK